MQERQTKQKHIIYEALKELNHPTATEVYTYVHQLYPSVSRATVFRVLGGFAENGKALELRFAGNDVRYDYRTKDHYHIRCKRCGKIADIEMSDDIFLNSIIVDSSGFRVDNFQINFFGLCPECQKELEKNKIIS